MNRFFLILLILGICSCAPITNRFYTASDQQIGPKENYTQFTFDPSNVYSVRITRTIKLGYNDPITNDFEYSDTPYPVFKNVTSKSDSSHVNEENYFILLGREKGVTSGKLLFLSTYYIKGYLLQNACYSSEEYFSTYPIQSIEAGEWELHGEVIDLFIKRKKDRIPFRGILTKEKLIITETSHPKQNSSSLYLKEQPMIEVNKIMNVGKEAGLTFMSQGGRQLLYPDWNQLVKSKVANGEELKIMLEALVKKQNISEIWIDLDGGRKKQLFLKDFLNEQFIGYTKKID